MKLLEADVFKVTRYYVECPFCNGVENLGERFIKSETIECEHCSKLYIATVGDELEGE